MRNYSGRWAQNVEQHLATTIYPGKALGIVGQNSTIVKECIWFFLACGEIVHAQHGPIADPSLRVTILLRR
jgi:hypothetical protein